MIVVGLDVGCFVFGDYIWGLIGGYYWMGKLQQHHWLKITPCKIKWECWYGKGKERVSESRSKREKSKNILES
jgi:hypothetical protein